MAFLDDLKQAGVVAVIRGASADAAVAMAEALVAGGVLAIEITYSTPDCCAAIKRAKAILPPTALVGVGTVLTVDQLDAAHQAGATYAVSPHTDEAIIRCAVDLKLPMMPGALTPTEIVRAWQYGATCVKIFPGSAVDPDYLKAVKAPLPHIPMMPTGGVSIDNLHLWLAAGAVAVGMGGNLAKGTSAEITAAAKLIAAKLAFIRTTH